MWFGKYLICNVNIYFCNLILFLNFIYCHSVKTKLTYILLSKITNNIICSHIKNTIYIFVRYYVIPIDFEMFYQQYPQRPQWVKVFTDEFMTIRIRRMPMDMSQIYDAFKKFFGVKRAIKYRVCFLHTVDKFTIIILKIKGWYLCVFLFHVVYLTKPFSQFSLLAISSILTVDGVHVPLLCIVV